jgi:hypothetical protein
MEDLWDECLCRHHLSALEVYLWEFFSSNIRWWMMIL